MRRSVVGAVLGSLFVAAGVPAARADVVVSQLACGPALPGPSADAGCARLSAFRGRLVWSSWEATARRYVLMTRVGGRAQRLPVPGRGEPFDVDLGPGPTGSVLAVYSRCAGDPAGPRRLCGVYGYDFTARSERRIARSVSARDLRPSVWGARLAVALPARRSRQVFLCHSQGAPRCRALPRGPGRTSRRGDAGPDTIDVEGGAVVVGWHYFRRGLAHGRALTEVLLELPSHARPRVIAGVDPGPGGPPARVFSPSLAGGTVTYARTGSHGLALFGTHRVAAEQARAVRAPVGVAAVARTRGAVYYTVCEGARCEIRLAARNVLADLADASVPQPCPAPGPRPSRWQEAGAIQVPSHLFGTQLSVAPNGAAIVALPGAHGPRIAYRPPGGRFGAPRSLGLPGVAEQVQVVLTAHGAILAWKRAQGVRHAWVQVATGDPQRGFSPAQTLAELNGVPAEVLTTRLAANQRGDAVVAWRESEAEVVHAAVRAAGGSFFGPVVVSAPVRRSPDGRFPAQTIDTPTVAIDDRGGALLAWTVTDNAVGAGGEITAAYMHPGGAFDSAMAVGGAAGFGGASVALGDGGGAIAWQQRQPTGERKIVVVPVDANGVLEPVRVISGPGADSRSAPLLTTASGGGLLAAWLEHDESAWRVTTASAPPRDAFGVPLRVFAVLTVPGAASYVPPVRLAGLAGVGVRATPVWTVRCGSLDNRVLAAGPLLRPSGAELVSGRVRRLAPVALGADAKGNLTLLLAPYGPGRLHVLVRSGRSADRASAASS